MTFEVSVQDGEIVLEFVTGAKNPGCLKLVGDSTLEGYLNVVVEGGRNQNRTFKLEKVQPKAGDVK